MVGILRFIVAGVAVGALLFSTATPVLAWHPEGKIQKLVQNQTTQSTLADANSAADAVAAKPGDTLKYVITVSNVGQPSSNGYNDMAKTVMTDTLPAGVELASDPAKRTISENLGTLKPGQKVTKEYVLKVTSTTNGAVIVNKACFTGDSTANDRPQAGCDVANVKVNVPTPPVTPPKTPEPPVESPKEAPQVLPSTGPEALLGGATGIGALVYSAGAYVRSRRNLAQASKQ